MPDLRRQPGTHHTESSVLLSATRQPLSPPSPYKYPHFPLTPIFLIYFPSFFNKKKFETLLNPATMDHAADAHRPSLDSCCSFSPSILNLSGTSPSCSATSSSATSSPCSAVNKCILVSEEYEEATFVDPSLRGKYCVVFDPLDGSSNIDCVVSIGTLVISTWDGVHCFTLDLSTHSWCAFSRSPKLLGVGGIGKTDEYNAIDTGMVADMHRTLLYGGIFLYPADKKSPDGKLRVLYEVFPMSFLVEQLGGQAFTGKQRA